MKLTLRIIHEFNHPNHHNSYFYGDFQIVSSLHTYIYRSDDDYLFDVSMIIDIVSNTRIRYPHASDLIDYFNKI